MDQTDFYRMIFIRIHVFIKLLYSLLIDPIKIEF